jgi:beta-glucosidase
MADIDALLGSLTVEEKAALTAGGGMMSTAAVERLGIPAVHVTDGPCGARGPSYPGLGGPPSTCIPCGSAIGATWDPDLARELGALVGREALDRGCRGLLAPTVNLHRSPLAGRNFECYSEDPLLSGRLGAAFVRGVQSAGVFATVKHFVGNDAEFERHSISSVIDERALRELYLLPFELAVREGGAHAVMTSYNRLNGRWLTQQPELLIGVLRDEWGFDGLVMTDWFAVADTVASLGAGLDLEMPGPARALGDSLLAAIDEGALDPGDLDAAVRRLLTGFETVGALDAPAPPFEPKPPSTADRALLRRAAADAIVLLRNDGVLPWPTGSLERVALVGPRAAEPCLIGGGSARVIPHRVVSLRETIGEALGAGVDVVHQRGCEADRSAGLVGRSVLRAPEGFAAEIFGTPDLSGEPVGTRRLDELRVFVFRGHVPGYPEGQWSMRVRGTIVPEEDGPFELALAQSGQARVFVDGTPVLDGFTTPPPAGGRDFFGAASQELIAPVRLAQGVPAEIVVEYACPEVPLVGFRVGFRTVDADALLERAVSAAAQADAAIVVVGTSEEWESEGFDRPFFELPGAQTELITRVAAVNDRVVVVVNAGAPVDLSWADQVAAVLQCWFGGEEMAAAVADVLVGRADPGGRLPTTVPARLEHNPSFDNFPGENGELRYGEGLFMGYRGYEHRGIEPRFAFGHGLSYTTFEMGTPTLSADTWEPGGTVTVEVPVTNTGRRAGTEVVQCYVAPHRPRLARPPKELKSFVKLRLAPGETAVARLELDDRSFAYWDPRAPDWGRITPRGASRPARSVPPAAGGWRVDPGRYAVLIGRSAGEIVATCAIEVRAADGPEP